MTLTPDQITWSAVSGSREVKRLPSHFVCLNCSLANPGGFGNAQAQLWSATSTDLTLKIICKLRQHIEENFVGRYFIMYNETSKHTPAVPPYSYLVAFEDPAEASFFSLKFEHLVKQYEKMIEEKII